MCRPLAASPLMNQYDLMSPLMNVQTRGSLSYELVGSDEPPNEYGGPLMNW